MATLIVPVKGLREAKSRLRLPGVPTEELVAAMLRDTVNAALAADVGPVVVVTPDDEVVAVARDLGAQALVDLGSLNEAITSGVTLAARSHAGSSRCAALLADLPALQAHDLRSVLTSHRRGFVPDRSGTGTTLAFDEHLQPAFGRDSASRHEAQGLPRIHLELCGLTVDVDTVEDLQVADRLGLGEHTRRIVQEQGADPR